MPLAPTVLYHYTTQTGLLGILKTNSIWATKIHYLNDASEYQLALELASGVLHSLLKGEKSTKKRRKVKALLDNLQMIEHMNICVCSLTEHRDLLSQWRAYAGGIAGFSIGLNTTCIEAQASQQGFTLVQCEYNERRQRELVEQIVVESLEQDFNTTPSRVDPTRPRTIIALPVGGDFAMRFAQLAPVIKSPAFHEESEWRHTVLGSWNANPQNRSEPKAVEKEKSNEGSLKEVDAIEYVVERLLKLKPVKK